MGEDLVAARMLPGLMELGRRQDANLDRQSRNQLELIQLQRDREVAGRREALAQVLGQWQPDGDNQEILQQVMGMDPQLGMKLQTHHQNLQTASQEERLKANFVGMQMLSAISSEPDDAKAAGMYGQALQQYKSMFPQFSGMLPEKFSRQWVDMAQQSMVSPEARLKAQQSAQDQWGTPMAAQDAQGNEILVSPNKRFPGVVPTQVVGAQGGLMPGGIRPRSQQPLVNIAGQEQEREESKAYGKFLVDKEYQPIVERAQQAGELLGNLKIAKGIDIQTGAFEPAKARVSAYVQALGIDPTMIGLPNASNAQALTGIMQNVVLHKMQAQKGPQTENDAKRIEMTVANLGQTPAAFKFLMGAASALEERTVEQRQFYDRYRAAKGSFQGAADAWEQYKQLTPLMVKSPRGLPVFFSDFREANPGISEIQLLQAWRKAAKGN